MRFISHAPARLAMAGVLAAGLSGGIAATESANAAPVQTARAAAPVTTARAAGFSAAKGVMAVRIASTKKGTPYRWGASGPRAFDCSGFTSWTFRKVGKKLPRTANAQYRAAIKIRRSSARPGDLVFYGGSHKYHVGIYAGNGRMWNAPRTGDVVKLAKVRRGAAYARVR